MYCGDCGKFNKDGLKFCIHCGADFTHQTNSSDDSNDLSRTAGDSVSQTNSYDDLDYAGTVVTGERVYAGAVLCGRYEVKGRIGGGGMGEVFLACDRKLDATVAIKILPAVLCRNQRSIENLKKEAAVSLKLTHPNICRLYNFEEDASKGVHFLVMEYIDGKTLQDIIHEREDEKMSLDELLPIAKQIAAALDYAHSQKPPVIHRDIKPANIMVDKNGIAKLLDFGIAREIKDSVTRVTGQYHTSGTLAYMSPEQFKGATLTSASDVYSFASVLYEALAGKPLISPHGDPSWQIIHKPVDRIEDVPKYVNDNIVKALAKELEDRPLKVEGILEVIPEMSVAANGQDNRSNQTESHPLFYDSKKSKPVHIEKKARKFKWVLLFIVLSVFGILSLRYFKETFDETKHSYTDQSGSFADNRVEKSSADSTNQPAQNNIVEIPVQESSSSSVQGIEPTDNIIVPQLPRENSDPKLEETSTRSMSSSKFPKPGHDFSILDLGMKMVWVGPGSFNMGSSNGYSRENPAHKVTISKGFWIGKYEVTQDEYEKIMGSNPSIFKGARRPVEGVSWRDAKEYCRKLTQRELKADRLPEGYEYRLPSEAQWEYAAKGGNKSKGYEFSGGDKIDIVGWYDSNGEGITHEVGKKKKNELGIYDMSGNVWEWCEDRPHADYAGAPTDGSAWYRGSPAHRINRGGSWRSEAPHCRAAMRGRAPLTETSDFLGIRVVLVPVHP